MSKCWNDTYLVVDTRVGLYEVVRGTMRGITWGVPKPWQHCPAEIRVRIRRLT